MSDDGDVDVDDLDDFCDLPKRPLDVISLLAIRLFWDVVKTSSVLVRVVVRTRFPVFYDVLNPRLPRWGTDCAVDAGLLQQLGVHHPRYYALSVLISKRRNFI